MDKLRRTFTGSATGALAGLLMVGAIAFGATVVRPMTFDRHGDATNAQANGTAWHDGDDGKEANNANEPSETPSDTPGGTDSTLPPVTAGLDAQSNDANHGTCQDEQVLGRCLR